ncbi:MAG TPA: hypothetical protein VMD59_21185, partial [Acidimicrobiales bacterium]|nr:hypothetical protein [Acidimicrobiales bacterium]
TAEIPVVPAAATAATERTARATLPAPVVAPRPKRLPAPVPLRQAVWFLAFVLALCAVGLWGLRSRPDWFAFARNQVGQPVPTGVSGTPGAPVASTSPTTHTTTAPIPSAFHLVSTVAGTPLPTVTYSVGTADYSVTISTTQRTWVEVKSPSSSTQYLVEAVEPAGWHETFAAVAGSVYIQVAAFGSTISISSDGQVVGSITDAKLADYVLQS